MSTRQELEARTYDQLLELYADSYKEIHGFRPQNRRPSREALIDFWASYDTEFEANKARKQTEEQRCIAIFEERIQGVLALMPHASRADAIRLISDDEGYDEEAIEDEFGLPYGYLKTAA